MRASVLLMPRTIGLTVSTSQPLLFSGRLTPVTEQPGRRERKKAATRKAIADTALRLFLERGYDAVGIREIAAAADVAITTLFAHFPSKEALVFDQDQKREERLIRAVTDRE